MLGKPSYCVRNTSLRSSYQTFLWWVWFESHQSVKSVQHKSSWLVLPSKDQTNRAIKNARANQCPVSQKCNSDFVTRRKSLEPKNLKLCNVRTVISCHLIWYYKREPEKIKGDLNLFPSILHSSTVSTYLLYLHFLQKLFLLHLLSEGVFTPSQGRDPEKEFHPVLNLGNFFCFFEII